MSLCRDECESNPAVRGQPCERLSEIERRHAVLGGADGEHGELPHRRRPAAPHHRQPRLLRPEA